MLLDELIRWITKMVLRIRRLFGYPYKWRCPEPGCTFYASSNSQEILNRVLEIHTHPPAIHKEPWCEGDNGCTYQDPHEHGFACDRSCTECAGQCHPDCPAYGTGK